MNYFESPNAAQIEHLSGAVNKALTLPKHHRFGKCFIEHYVLARVKKKALLTTHQGIAEWCRKEKFHEQVDAGRPKPLTLTPKRYNVLIGLLQVFSVVMGKNFTYLPGEGADQNVDV